MPNGVLVRRRLHFLVRCAESTLSFPSKDIKITAWKLCLAAEGPRVFFSQPGRVARSSWTSNCSVVPPNVPLGVLSSKTADASTQFGRMSSIAHRYSHATDTVSASEIPIWVDVRVRLFCRPELLAAEHGNSNRHGGL
jgi:hypothetical protein